MYLDRESNHRARYPVPVKDVVEAVDRWLEENSEGWVRGRRNDGRLSPMGRLAVRVDMSESSCSRAVYRMRHESRRVSAEVAERFLSAVGREDVCEPAGLHSADKEWMRPEEREKPRAWARRVLLSMSEQELALVAQLAPLGTQDDSSFARRRRAA